MSEATPQSYAQLRAQFPDLPETPLIVLAFDHARDHMPAFLFNHVVRSWIFAARVGALDALTYDAEVVAVATLFHDFGLTPLGDGPHRFEVNGANVAARFAREHGFDTRRVQLLWDSIALHVTHSISLFKETEVALCSRGIGVDFGAPDHGRFGAEEIAAILAAAPRLDMKRQFASCACHLARTKPETTYDTFIRDFGERYVPGYQAPSWVDAIAGGPFSE